ncbi:hypothetical protein SteCoe_33376 [Stentor coeruleus]|uniref:Uncharacterized protein n=1 Tax=Stentor coeruleus TaxID=5963 RepID=A0A1R2AWV9_9CILI|nr:hypothetical protein SteCoe_33376 [Stentor coeruleus]
METTNSRMIIECRKKLLLKFCEEKLSFYQNDFVEAILVSDWKKLRVLSRNLSKDCENLEAPELVKQSLILQKELKEFEKNFENIQKCVDTITRFLSNLRIDYKDYSKKTCYFKKINTLTTLTTVKYLQKHEDFDNEIELYEEIDNQWRCCIQ